MPPLIKSPYSIRSFDYSDTMRPVYSVMFHAALWHTQSMQDRKTSLQSCGVIYAVLTTSWTLPLTVAESTVGEVMTKYGSSAISKRFKEFLLSEEYSDDATAGALTRMIKPFLFVRETLITMISDGLHTAVGARYWSTLKSGGGILCDPKVTLYALQGYVPSLT